MQNNSIYILCDNEELNQYIGWMSSMLQHHLIPTAVSEAYPMLHMVQTINIKGISIHQTWAKQHITKCYNYYLGSCVRHIKIHLEIQRYAIPPCQMVIIHTINVKACNLQCCDYVYNLFVIPCQKFIHNNETDG